jgi:CMP-N-acetylneuraminic acid synthetase
MDKVAVVLSRAGSTRVKGKNSRRFYDNLSLLQLKLRQLVDSSVYSLIISASDCDKCLSQSSEIQGVTPFQRSPYNCADDSSSIDALNEVLIEQSIKESRITLHQCNSPFVNPKIYTEFELRAQNINPDETAFTVHRSYEDIWSIEGNRIFKGEPRRQQERSGFYIENSAMYSFPVVNSSIIFDLNKTSLFEIEPIMGFDINNEADFKIASILANEIKYA